MVILEYTIQLTLLLTLFLSMLKLNGIILTKANEHSNSFRVLTQSLFLPKREENIHFLTKKYELTKISTVKKSTLHIKKNYYLKNSSSTKRPLPLLLNQKGEIHIFSSMLFLLILISTIHLTYIQFLKTRSLIERKNNYLCLAQIIKKNFDYTKEMERLNKIIAINYPLQFNPKTGPIHKGIIKASKLLQEVSTKRYRFQNFKHYPHCSKTTQLQLLTLSHYEENFLGVLTRDPFEMTVPNLNLKVIRIFNKTYKNDYFVLTFFPIKNFEPATSNIKFHLWKFI